MRNLVLASADRFASAFASFTLTIIVARATSPEVFGQFALAQALLLIAIGAVPAVLGAAIMTHASGPDATWESTEHWVWRIGLVLIVPLGLLSIEFVELRSLIAPLWLWAVALMMMEARRSVFYCKASYVRIFFFSLAFFAAAILGLLLTSMGVQLQIALWAVAVAQFLTALLAQGRPPRLSPRERSAGPSELNNTLWQYTSLYVTGSIPALLTPYLVGWGAGATAVAAIRGSQTIAGAAMQVPNSLSSYILAQFVQRDSWRANISLMIKYSATVAGFSLLVGIVFLDRFPFGTLILGETWPRASPVFVPILASMGLATVVRGGEMLLKWSGRLTAFRRLRTRSVIPFGVCLYVGVVVHGAFGAAWVLVFYNSILVLGFVWAARAGRR